MIKNNKARMAIKYGGLILLFIVFFYREILNSKKPSQFQRSFNLERQKLSIPIIEDHWIPKNDHNSVYQIWYNRMCSESCHWIKYVNCDTRDKSIKSEIDIYIIGQGDERKILSIMYNYSDEKTKWKCLLKKYEPPFEDFGLFGYPTDIINHLTFSEAEKILLKHKVRRLNYYNYSPTGVE